MAKANIANELLEPQLPDFCPITHAIEELAVNDGASRGAIFTRSAVVDFILDLSGYTADKPLWQKRCLEPSFGHGDFLLPAIDRLLEAWCLRGSSPDQLVDAVRAVELHHQSYMHSFSLVVERLIRSGISIIDANRIADTWLIQGDFLLSPLDGTFDFVIGNPPYVRQEHIPDPLIAEYRRRYKTIFDRADLYVPFIERSLSLLSAKGKLGFICADRWMKNKYGRELRSLVSREFNLDVYVDMVDTEAFHVDVVAYPAITIIGRDRSRETRIAIRPNIDAKNLSKLANQMNDTTANAKLEAIKMINLSPLDSEPWIFDTSPDMTLIRRLESKFQTIEEAGCKVGIGVATGADKSFIGPFDELEVEEDRKLPLVTTKDIRSGAVEWQGLGVVNPFAPEGGLVDLDDYPKLRAYFEARRDQIESRHIARKAPKRWYRTIDRIYPDIAKQSKLLIPDIKGDAHIVLENGQLYPHHNLYFITSNEWPIAVLQKVLISGIARLFVAAYSTKMRGGYLRFQAQYLRRIRIPNWQSIEKRMREQLVESTNIDDDQTCFELIYRIYGLSADEILLLDRSGG